MKFNILHGIRESEASWGVTMSDNRPIGADMSGFKLNKGAGFYSQSHST